MLEHVRAVFRARERFGFLRRSTFFDGQATSPGIADVAFYTPAGVPMQGHDWADESRRALMIGFGDPAGGELLLLLQGGEEDVVFKLPPRATRFALVVASDASSVPADDATCTLAPGGSAVLYRVITLSRGAPDDVTAAGSRAKNLAGRVAHALRHFP